MYVMTELKLITGSFFFKKEEAKELVQEYASLSKVTVFFDNSNFLLTKYRPLSNGVHLILEFEDKRELHIENSNCGYYGNGPRATVDILGAFGLGKCKSEVENLVCKYDALQFSVENNQVIPGTIYVPLLFYSGIRYNISDKSLRNKIVLDRNVSIDLVKRKVMFYNPQRHSWKGFLNLLGYMDEIEIEYYIGENSPLEGYLYLEKDFRQGFATPDISGVNHVNLIIHGANFDVVCLVDKRCEVQVIDSVYLALTGENLFVSEQYNVLLKRESRITKLLKPHRTKEKDFHAIMKVDEKKYDRFNERFYSEPRL